MGVTDEKVYRCDFCKRWDIDWGTERNRYLQIDNATVCIVCAKTIALAEEVDLIAWIAGECRRRLGVAGAKLSESFALQLDEFYPENKAAERLIER